MQHLVNALGWMLVHFIWQGSLIAGALWLTIRMSNADSARLRYWSGLAAYLACILAPLFTLMYYLRPAASLATGAELTLPTLTVATGYRVSAWQFLQQGLEPALPLIVLLWALGVAILSSKTFMGWLGTRRLIRKGTEPVNERLQQVAEALRLRLGVRRMVRVLSSTRVAVPTLIGWLKPVILLPASVIAQLPREQLELVLAHELAHVRRHDYLINLLQLVIETLFFYHPAIRWMSRQVGQEREHCCDDMVVANCGRPLVYARALASLEAMRGPVRPPALSASGGDLFQRVSRIVRQDLPARSSGFAQVALIAGIAFAASLSARHGIEIARVATISEPTGLEWSVSASMDGAARAALGTGYRQHGEEARQADLMQAAAVEQERERQERAARLASLTAIKVRGRRQDLPVFEPVLQPGPDALEVASIEQPAKPDEFEIVEEESATDLFQPTVKTLRAVAPEYPARAVRRDLEGYVKLRFSVSGRGEAVQIEVVDAQPEAIFDKSAIKALKKWRFEVSDNHDPDTVLVQIFDFAFEEVEVQDPQSRRCSLTGTRICPKNVTEELLQSQYNKNSR